MPEKSLCIQVDPSFGEKTIRSLTEFDLINKNLKIKNTRKSLLIPITRKPNFNELKILNSKIINFQFKKEKFILRKPHKKTIEELLNGKIPNHLLKKVPHSLDIIGDIAIVEVPKDFKKYDKLLGEAILKVNKNIKTVLSKLSPIKSTYRIRIFNFLAGEKRTHTTHLEYGCKYSMDITKVYFSPRLSKEHNRIASLINQKEIIIDLFAGIGPFSIPIAKKNPESKIISVDINPSAIEYLNKNIRLNRVDNKITPYLGDARSLINDHLSGIADRVIMNLPEKAAEFIDVACKVLKSKGGIIHYYEFIQRPDSINNAQNRLKNSIKRYGRTIDQFLYIKRIRETAPYQDQVVFDIKII
jgi:tRNA (guanine37-N1)-methyltransferase